MILREIKMKTIVTHINPHLDEICAAYLLQHFHPDFKGGVAYKFVPAGLQIGKPASSTVYLGVGQKFSPPVFFDEHGGIEKECAASLVWNWFKKEGYAPQQDPALNSAIERLVEFVLKDDTGQFLGKRGLFDFSIATVFSFLPYLDSGSQEPKRIKIGFQIIEALLKALKTSELVRQDWHHRKEFMTPWGKGVGLETCNIKSAINYSYSKGFIVLAVVHPAKNYRQIRAQAKSSADLTPVFDWLKKNEPGAYWFLHHSKKLLLSGDDVQNNNITHSNLTLGELINLLHADGEIFGGSS